MRKFLRKVAAGVLAAVMLISTAAAESAAPEQVSTESDVTYADGILGTENPEDMISLQDSMRAVFMTPEADFSMSGDGLSDIFNEVLEYGLNAVIINTSSEDGVFYNFDLSEQDNLNSVIALAHNAGLCVYLTLDCGKMIEDVIEQGGGLKEGFSAQVHKFAMKYSCEGILLTNYYTQDNDEMYAEYLRSGSGIGYENWLYEINEYIIRTISEIVHKTSNTTAVGLLIEDMWANKSSNEEGSATADTVEALYDGFCDTKKYVESKYVDFNIVKAYGSTESSTMNFENVISWWFELDGKYDIKTYVCHINERIGNRAGWNDDQLLRQLAVMEKMDGIGGSAFNSFKTFRDNPLDSTNTLLKYFNDQINTQTLWENLEMISPSQLNYVTYDNIVKFAGTFDENFDVYLDGKKITLNEAGNFFIQRDLKVGKNTFVIEHKGKKFKYVIDRKVEVIKTIGTTTDIKVEGGTRIMLQAVAYSGSKVSASINGKIVNLTVKPNSEIIDVNGSYCEYVGYYTAPEGIIGSEQSLGKITYYANYSGIEKYLTGGSVTVEAKPMPPQTDITVDIKDQSAAGTGEVVGQIDPIKTEKDYVKYIKVLKDYTRVFDPKMTGAVPSPVFVELPMGTLDYYKSTVDGYVISTTGKRYRASDVKLFDDVGLDLNELKVLSAGNKDGKSFIKMNLRFKSSFNVTTSVGFTEGLDGPFKVESFTPQYVYITFDNVTSVTKLPEFSACTLFSEGEWETVTVDGIPKFRMKLKLRQAGIYGGVSATYDKDGDLLLQFRVITPSIAGKVIVIDPGHGMTEKGTIDPGAIGEVTEQVLVRDISKKLKSELEARGAIVYRLDTENNYYPTAERSNFARTYNADLYVALHCNSALNQSAHGVEVYYFTPFSQPLAKYINNSLSACYDNKFYGDGTSSSRGDKYSYYKMTLEQSVPSVMVEMGFVSNARECLMMANPDNQVEIAKAIELGIEQFFARSTLTSE
ncbi:MAG: N-acetylmuramoyl-L-alanine amidase [Oscillospiraceae bacterium]